MAKSKLKLDLDKLKEIAFDAVRESEALGGPGTEKFDRARKSVVQWLDDQLRFGPGPVGIAAEAVSDVLIRIIAGPVVEWVWSQLFGGKGKA